MPQARCGNRFALCQQRSSPSGMNVYDSGRAESTPRSSGKGPEREVDPSFRPEIAASERAWLGAPRIILGGLTGCG